MSGHSKWSTIKRKKGANDAKRGAIFTRLSKDIALAAREGGDDPDMNSALRLAIKKAKSSNMPSSNIERAIKKGTGQLEGVNYESHLYEGYGPHGVAIMMEVMTDNKNRTIPEIRHIMSKNSGNLGESGCVSWIFEKKGTITIDKKTANEDKLINDCLEFEVDDISSEDDTFYEIIVNPDIFNDFCSYLEKKEYSVEAELCLSPQNTVKVSSSNSSEIINLLTLLEDHEDIQKVYSNLEIENIN
tara:strand:- start:498 stop:1229 length:732 start_codon:yes stop_codon:yes gene_type:complete